MLTPSLKGGGPPRGWPTSGLCDPICLGPHIRAEPTEWLSLACGHGQHVRCSANLWPRRCALCRTPTTADDMAEFQSKMLGGTFVPPPASEENSELEVPRIFVGLCCPRIGPPPDFVVQSDWRMEWQHQTMSYFCNTCHREASLAAVPLAL